MASSSDRFDRFDPPFLTDEPTGSRELRDIARRLAEIAADLHDNAALPSAMGRTGQTPQDTDEADRRIFLRLARKTYWLRRQRASIFGCAEMFGEPAWDILLDLYIASAEGKQVSVSSACIGSACPPTTGLRWLAILTEQGFVVRENDSNDNRRVMVRLSDKGVAAMERFLASVAA
jgi:hypothetical protein